MTTISDLKKNMDAFMASLASNIDRSIVLIDSQLLDLERDQLKNKQVTSFGEPIQPEYSSFWKSVKGLTYPNLFDTGDFQKKLILNVHYPEYEIHSEDYKNEKLTKKYKNIHGIAPYNVPKASEIIADSVIVLVNSEVFK